MGEGGVGMGCSFDSSIMKSRNSGGGGRQESISV